jgi:hypothetical protein
MLNKTSLIARRRRVYANDHEVKIFLNLKKDF